MIKFAVFDHLTENLDTGVSEFGTKGVVDKEVEGGVDVGDQLLTVDEELVRVVVRTCRLYNSTSMVSDDLPNLRFIVTFWETVILQNLSVCLCMRLCVKGI